MDRQISVSSWVRFAVVPSFTFCGRHAKKISGVFMFMLIHAKSFDIQPSEIRQVFCSGSWVFLHSFLFPLMLFWARIIGQFIREKGGFYSKNFEGVCAGFMGEKSA
jgi:hypothetical protein